MRYSPNGVYEQLRETVCSYLETAYRISNPTIFKERGRLIREEKIVSRLPFIETTPRFKSTIKLKDLDIPYLPPKLADLSVLGLLDEKFPLYAHQEKALRYSWKEDGKPGNLLVATGTGSGKTETFYLPVLAEILRDAQTWLPPRSSVTPRRGYWNGIKWIDSRAHEQRPKAVKALILYPMNALVNDQLRRLRRTLASKEAIDWQLNNLNGNLIYFGRYTGQTKLPGLPSDTSSKKWEEYIRDVTSKWQNFDEESKKLGDWPNPEGPHTPEMLGRWDMQAAPPDILITNYSMLEYMLVRPIEAPIFEATRQWLSESKDHIFNLVLDEAHTYSGARGTEVAYLIRRLYERLGVHHDQVRCIATSASLGEDEVSLAKAKHFVGELFGQQPDKFTIIRAEQSASTNVLHSPDQALFEAFVNFQHSFASSENDDSCFENLVAALPNTSNEATTIHGKLYEALVNLPTLLELQRLTARNATPLQEVADKLWQNLGTEQERLDATAGLLAVGANARPENVNTTDIPPLLPSRIHMMFRGLPGLWACVDPNCTEVSKEFQGDRPCGRLYAYPRVWCNCGARVLEVFTCRVCGILYLGGIEDTLGELWPYEADLENGYRQYDRYKVFLTEDPDNERNGQTFRSVVNTREVGQNDPEAKKVWVEPGRTSNDKPWPFPSSCPRCNAWYNPKTKREIIEPFETRGLQSFTALAEEAFRLQVTKKSSSSSASNTTPNTPKPSGFGWTRNRRTLPAADKDPNGGRKLLIFSDSRQEAATLATELEYGHNRDLFRQLIVRTFEKSGKPELGISELAKELITLAVERGIDPTLDEMDDFWDSYTVRSQETLTKAAPYVEAHLRNEISNREIGLEPLGLARWIPRSPEDQSIYSSVFAIQPFSKDETLALVNILTRILASENLILPNSRQVEDWPDGLVSDFAQRVLREKSPASSDLHVYEWKISQRSKNRLSRYLVAIMERAGYRRDEAINELTLIMDQLLSLLKDMEILEPAQGRITGLGIPLDRLAIAQMPTKAYRCRQCSHVSAEAVKLICLRCQGRCDLVETSQINQERVSYYHRLAAKALNGKNPQGLDPFPLRVREHTAQISADVAADRERYFKGRFITTGDQPENPLAKRVDILSVTTTMEMGIDIGDLTTVGLRNVPPTVANYQQRAGRAGRRSDGVATVITQARDRSHDQYYFNRTKDIISGQVRVPVLNLHNKIIAQRHANAILLQSFFSKEYSFSGRLPGLFNAFGTVSDFRNSTPKGIEQLRQYFAENKASLIAQLQEVNEVFEFAVLEDWVELLPDKVERVVDGAPDASEHGARDDSELLEVLISGGLMPRYAFPIDLVSLWLEAPSRYSEALEINRDLKVALSEFAPGSEVIVDGKVYKSVGLYKPFEKSPSYQPDAWYFECKECGAVEYRGFSDDDTLETPPLQICQICSSHLTVVPSIKPEGFCTDWNESPDKYRGGGRERVGSSSFAQLHAGPSAQQAGSLHNSGRFYTHFQDGQLFVTNRGDKNQGFKVCGICGRVEDISARRNESHTKPTGKGKCNGKFNKIILTHNFRTDLCLISVILPDELQAELQSSEDGNQVRGRGAWLSLGYALQRAASVYLQIDPQELAVGVRPWKRENGSIQGEIFLYDTLPNGAGYAREIIKEIDAILKLALEICTSCPADCETACYFCLHDYSNQKSHPILDRRLSSDLLRFMLYGELPSLGQAQKEEALSFLQKILPINCSLELNTVYNGVPVISVLKDGMGKTNVVQPVHSLFAVTPENISRLESEIGLAGIKVVSEFDLKRRPQWVLEHLRNS